jgi:hypothetical protein
MCGNFATCVLPVLHLYNLEQQAPWVPEAVAWRMKAAAVAPAANHTTSSMPTYVLDEAFCRCKLAQAAKAQAAEVAVFRSGANTVLAPEAARR